MWTIPWRKMCIRDRTMGFPGYFLIVQDFIRAAREELDVSVGPGRGSAAGSAVAYCLGITQIDPIAYDLPVSYTHLSLAAPKILRLNKIANKFAFVSGLFVSLRLKPKYANRP